jgi:hypothetical protein
MSIACGIDARNEASPEAGDRLTSEEQFAHNAPSGNAAEPCPIPGSEQLALGETRQFEFVEQDGLSPPHPVVDTCGNLFAVWVVGGTPHVARMLATGELDWKTTVLGVDVSEITDLAVDKFGNLFVITGKEFLGIDPLGRLFSKTDQAEPLTISGEFLDLINGRFFAGAPGYAEVDPAQGSALWRVGGFGRSGGSSGTYPLDGAAVDERHYVSLDYEDEGFNSGGGYTYRLVLNHHEVDPDEEFPFWDVKEEIWRREGLSTDSRAQLASAPGNWGVALSIAGDAERGMDCEALLEWTSTARSYTPEGCWALQDALYSGDGSWVSLWTDPESRQFRLLRWEESDQEPAELDLPFTLPEGETSFAPYGLAALATRGSSAVLFSTLSQGEGFRQGEVGYAKFTLTVSVVMDQ